jgi:dihydrofolate synthase/folylpolyglutamate synthase
VWEKGEQTQMDAFLDYEGKTEWQPVHLTIPLLGYHQVVNAATAFTTLRVLSNLGWKLSLDVIRKGFSQVQWPGRFEVINQNPLIIVDSAHNQDSALKLRLTVDDYLPEQAITLVFGVSEDKDVHGMFVELLPRVKRVVVTQSQHPRAMSSQRLADMVHQFGRPAILTTTIEDALAQAVAAADDGSAILVAGSLFVAAAARETCKKKQKGKDEK